MWKKKTVFKNINYSDTALVLFSEDSLIDAKKQQKSREKTRKHVSIDLMLFFQFALTEAANIDILMYDITH